SETCAHVEARASKLQAMVGAALRKCPIDGVVTGAYASAGSLVPRNRPLVRVDNPEGYRVVTLVDRNVRERIEPGERLTLGFNGVADPAKLEKIEAGWDRELFKYWLWLKPETTAG